MNSRKIIMSGMRPTGKLHLGHYLGVLTNWVELQNEYDCFFAIADWHALTTKFDRTEDLKQDIYDVTLDWLASGVNPEKAVIYVQSQIPEIAELHLYLSMITPQSWVERDPTLKDMVKILRNKEAGEQGSIINYGLLGYPILQTADILIFNAHYVPVGVDQVAHLEISRDITRRFNNTYNTDFFNEPEPKLTQIPLFKGIDGQKMGKSFHNDIKISDDEKTVEKKIMQCITDRNRIRKTDNGNPENCEVVYPYYKIFADENTVEKIGCKCKSAEIGCADCKRCLAKIVNEKLAPIREKRQEYASNKTTVENILKEGNEKARSIASENLKEIKKIIKMY